MISVNLYVLKQAECLQTYYKAQHYFVFQQEIEVPEIVNFWSYQPIRFSLTQQIKKWTSIPKIQASSIAAIGKTVAEVTSANTAANAAKLSATGLEDIAKVIDPVTGKVTKFKFKEGDSVSIAASADGTIPALADDLIIALETIVKEDSNAIATLGTAASKESVIFDEAGYAIPSTLKKEAAAVAQVEVGENITSMIGQDITKVADTATALKITTPGVEVTSEAEIAAASQVKNLSDQEFRILISTKLATTQDSRFAEVAELLAARQSVAEKSLAEKAVTKKMYDTIWMSKKDLTYAINSQIKDLKKNPVLLDADAKVIATRIAELKGISSGLTNNLALTAAKSSIAKREMWFAIIMDVAIQMGIMLSAPIGIHWVDAADAKIFAQLKLKQTKLKNDFLVKINTIQALSQEQIQLSEQAASWGLGILKTQQDQLSSIFSSQQTYLLQSLVTANLANNYVSNPMIWDQYFLNAPMYTPSFNGAAIQAKNNADNGVSAIPYPIQQPVFYSGSWAVSPILRTNNVSDTYLWKVINGKLTLDALTLKPVVSLPATVLPTIAQPFPTQSLPHTWYNIGRRGNWGYSPTDDSFYQYQSVSNVSSRSSQIADPVEAGLNAIFTEYVPPVILDSVGVATYQIQAEIQVAGVKSPWIAGIMFNGGRWISGVTDQSNQYRLCGLYGSGKDLVPISFFTAESFYVTSTITGIANLHPITPIAQILNPTSIPTDSKNIGNVIKNPLYPSSGITNQTALALGQTYVITIYTQPTQFFVSLDMKNNDGSLKNIFGPVALANRNPILFNFHTIGFISSGCSTRFSLKKPQQLVFDPADITTFTQSISSGAKS